MQRDSVRAGERVLLVDDWVETGSQARAVHHLVRQRGAHLVGSRLSSTSAISSGPGEPDDVLRLVDPRTSWTRADRGRGPTH